MPDVWVEKTTDDSIFQLFEPLLMFASSHWKPGHERAEANHFYCVLSKILTLRTVSIIMWLYFYVRKPGIVCYWAVVNGTADVSMSGVAVVHRRQGYRFFLSCCLPSSVHYYVTFPWHKMKPAAPIISYTYSSPSRRKEESRPFHLLLLLYQGRNFSRIPSVDVSLYLTDRNWFFYSALD